MKDLQDYERKHKELYTIASLSNKELFNPI